jgi:FAD-dependent urate hydroxylase
MSTTSIRQAIQTHRPYTQQYNVVVVGAGPYGLSAAAHLAAKGLKVGIFGKPLELWQEKMPKGMFLRSHWWASNLSDPQKKYGLKQFFEVSEYKICYPMPIQLFIDYGMWFQKHVVPFVDPTYISSIERNSKQFVLTLEDGRVVASSAVVMAVGPRYYQHIPSEFAHLPAELLTHSNDHSNFSCFSGKKVAVIGGGQSALEWAALLNEAGASVNVVARRPIVWAEHHGEANRSLIERLRAPDSGIAPGWKYRALEVFPYFFQRFPLDKKARMVRNTHWPTASNWLRDRILGKVVLHEGQMATKIVEDDKGVKLTISDNTRLNLDHVIVATGYQTNVSRVTMLSPCILADIKTRYGSPILNPWFECSVPGLYFIGFSSLQSFGPLYRFVAGAPATASRIAHAVAHHSEKIR